jgi:uncharacterized protein YjbI with pentapeptide repeats
VADPSRSDADKNPSTPEKEGWSLRWLVLIGLAVSTIAGALAAGILARLASGEGSWWRFWTQKLSSDEWYDVMRSDVAVVGLLGLGGAALIAYRRQRTSEAAHRLSTQQHQLELRRHDLVENTDLRARYAAASEQLGHAKPAVRLAGVYAMAQLADDWGLTDPAQRQVCIDVLCAYLRMPYDPEQAEPGEREVRLTIISAIRQRLQNPDSPSSWCGRDLDFTGATFDGGSFDRAVFLGGTVSFDRAVFSGGAISFVGAEFSGATVSFARAVFSAATVDVKYALFSAGNVAFNGAEFSGGSVSFATTTLTGAIVSFPAARFSGCDVSFDGAEQFDGTLQFSGAEFSAGNVSFFGTQFGGGGVIFGAKFTGGTVEFKHANFAGGRVTFGDAKFAGGTLDFSSARVVGQGPAGIDWGNPPPGVVPPRD